MWSALLSRRRLRQGAFLTFGLCTLRMPSGTQTLIVAHRGDPLAEYVRVEPTVGNDDRDEVSGSSAHWPPSEMGESAS